MRVLKGHIIKNKVREDSGYLHGKDEGDGNWMWGEGTNGLPLSNAIYNSLMMQQIGKGMTEHRWKTLERLISTPKIRLFG